MDKLWKYFWTFLVLLCVGSVLIAQLMLKRRICETDACIVRSHQIIQSMNSTVDPCDDFYQFACGGYLREKNYFKTKPVLNALIESQETLKQNLYQSLMQVNATNPEHPRFLRQIRIFMDSCLKKNPKTDRATSLRNILKKIGADFSDDPQLISTNGFSLERSLYLMTRIGLDYATPLDIQINKIRQRTKSDPLILINLKTSTAQLWSNELYDLEDPDTIRNYFPGIREIETAFGIQISDDHLSQLVTLQQRFYSIYEHRQSLKSVNITVADMQETFPQVNWTLVVESVIYNRNFNQFNVPSVSMTVVDLSVLDEVLTIISDTDPFILVLHQALDVIAQINNLPIDWPLKWDQCLGVTANDFPYAINHLQANSVDSEQIRKYTTEMAVRIRSRLERSIAKSHWYDKPAFLRAKEKLNATQLYIAYSDEDLNITYLELFHQDLTMIAEDPINNQLMGNMMKKTIVADEAINFDAIGLPFRILSIVNAWAIMDKNAVMIPLGILQNKFFDIDVPDYMNYAAIGTIIGHELMHAFDLKNRELFEERNKCFQDQYDAIIDPETNLKLNGTATVFENTADLSGLLSAYHAYKELTQGSRQFPTLPGLDYTPDQLYWLSFGVSWCASYENRKLQHFIRTYEHAPERHRINHGLRNVPEFARDFNCATGRPMNPFNKCTVF